jgi:uncharacterized protein YciI
MFKKLLFLVFLLIAFQPVSNVASAGNLTEKSAKKQFVYVLKLKPDYKVEKNWTPAVNETVGKHFNHLKALTDKGTVIMAGRTDYNVTNDHVFGIVVFEAENLEEATKIMLSDPAVIGKVMTAEVHPFSVALMRK